MTRLNKFFENPESLNNKETEEMAKFVRFIARAKEHYLDLTEHFHESIYDLLLRYSNKLVHELRHAIITSLIFLVNKKLIPIIWYVTKVFFLFEQNDKVIRSLIFRHIVNLCKKEFKLNSENKGKLKTLLIYLSKSTNVNIAKRVYDILTELYKKKVWRDKQIVFILADGLSHIDNKISIRCCCFFLNETLLNDGEDDQTSYNILSKKQLKKQLSVDRKRNKNFVVKQIDRNTISFDAIDFLPDPQ